MKWIDKISLFLILFILGISSAYAACSTEEMNKIRNEAVQIKPSYEKSTKLLGQGDYHQPDGADPEQSLSISVPYFKIYVDNLTENLYVTVHNSATDETKKYTYADSENGKVTFEWEKIVDVVDYTITVYSSDKTACPDTQLYVTNLKTPRYNTRFTDKLCTNAKDFYLCREFITTEDTDYVDFMNKVQKYLDGKVNNEGEEITNPEKNNNSSFLAKNKTVIIIAGVGSLIIIGVGATVIIVKKRRKKNEQI